MISSKESVIAARRQQRLQSMWHEYWSGPTPIRLDLWLQNYFRKHKEMGKRDRATIRDLIYLNVRRLGAHFGAMRYELPSEQIAKELRREIAEYMPTSEDASFTFPSWVMRLLERRTEISGWTPQEESRFVEQHTTPPPRWTWNVDTRTTAKLDENLSQQRCILQDLASQHIANSIDETKGDLRIWDTCAGAGGKSIYLRSKYPKAEIFATDVRENALSELKKRFQELNLTTPKTRVMDLLRDPFPEERFDWILIDAPCTGSGTWRRNPEQLWQLTQEELDRCLKLQSSILSRIAAWAPPGTHIVYATCSWFVSENEDQIEQLTERVPLKVISQKIFGSPYEDADTMFAAVMKKI